MRGVGCHHADVRQGNVQDLGCSLCDDRVVALTAVSTGKVDGGLGNVARSSQLDTRVAVLLVAKGESHILIACCKADAALDGGRLRLAGVVTMLVCVGYLCWPAPMSRFVLFPARCGCSRGHDCGQADATRNRSSNREQLVLGEDILKSQLNRVHGQRFGKAIHLCLGRKVALRAAEAAKCSARDIIGVHGICVDGRVRRLVRTRAGQRGVAEHLVAGVHVGAAICNDLDFDGGQHPVFLCSPLGVDLHRVAFAVTGERLLASPDGLHGTPHPALGKPPDHQRERDLHGHVFPTAERAADGRIDDAHPVGRKAQRMRDLLLVFMRPLACDLHGDPARIIDIGHTRLGLKIGVFLDGRLVHTLDDDICISKPLRCVALADAIAVAHVAGRVRVKQVGAGLHSLLSIQHQWQVFPFDPNQLARCARLHFRLSYDKCDLVSDKANHICPGFIRARAAEDRLVFDLKSVLVYRDIFRRKHCHDARCGLSSGCVDAQHAAMDAAGEQGRHVELVRIGDVAGIERLAGHLARCIDACGVGSHSLSVLDGFVNLSVHWTAFSTEAAASTASRIL